MAHATVGFKGQITIPASVRSALGIGPGSRIEFVKAGRGTYFVIAATSPLLALKGILAKPKHPVSIGQMNEAIAEEGARANGRACA